MNGAFSGHKCINECYFRFRFLFSIGFPIYFPTIFGCPIFHFQVGSNSACSLKKTYDRTCWWQYRCWWCWSWYVLFGSGLFSLMDRISISMASIIILFVLCLMLATILVISTLMLWDIAVTCNAGDYASPSFRSAFWCPFCLTMLVRSLDYLCWSF